MSIFFILKNILKRFRALVYGISHSGDGRECPLCGKCYNKFGRGGVEKRDDSHCVNCGSLERHRFLWLFLQRKTGLIEQKNLSVLHFAPERCVEKKLREYSFVYIKTDLEDKNADIKTDITRTPFKKDKFSIIICSHVLEHVSNDREALAELKRIIKPDGIILIIIPVERDTTIEDPSITEPAERQKIFGQSDHVRIYGRDFINRLTECGLYAESFLPKDLFDTNDLIKYGINIESDGLYTVRRKN